jgi:hypothetical protein
VLAVYTNLLSINIQFCSAYEQSEILELNIRRKTAQIKWLRATCGAVGSAALCYSVNKPSRDSRDTFHESDAFRESTSGECSPVWQ